MGQTLWVKLRAQLSLSRMGIALYDIAAPRTPGVEVEPVGYLEQQDAQVLMDDLWSAGVRPTEGAGTAGSMAATKAHLDHMTRLLDQVLPLALPRRR